MLFRHWRCRLDAAAIGRPVPLMVWLSDNENGALSQKYAPDGRFIPRTYLLSSSGDDPTIYAARGKYL